MTILQICTACWTLGVIPDNINMSEDQSLVFYFFKGEEYAMIEWYNTGEAVAITTPTRKAWDLSDDIEAEILNIKRYLTS